MKFKLIIWTLVFTSPFLYGQTHNNSKIDSIFNEYKDSPGCAIGIVKNGKTIFSKGYGYANLDYDIPITDSSIFNIASMSKQFTAACAAILIRNGELSLDDDINIYLPELKRFKDTIKIRHLIHHTSGLWPYEQLLFIGCYNLGNYLDNEIIYNWINQQDTLLFRPGTKFSYCNSGYVFLAMIIERITQNSLNDFASKNIFQPCNMYSTFYYDSREKVIPNRVVSYEYKQNDFSRFLDNHIVYGEGGINTTINDLIKWHDCLFNDKVGEKGFLDIMLQTDTFPDGKRNNYAFGLYNGKYKGNYYIAHAGSMHGYRTNMYYYPKDTLSIIFLANLASINSHNAIKQLSDIYLDTLDTNSVVHFNKKKKSEASIVNIKPKDYLGTYHSDMFNTDYEIFIKNENLLLKRGFYEPIDLKFVKIDEAEFYLKKLPYKIKFQRLDNNDIGNIIVESVRDVKFVFEKVK
jgi:CubicO group peptidase (beta-lactamase class C family)